MFSELYLKPSYFTDRSDVVNDFYNPVLEKTTRYERVSGYFSSKALAAYGKGLQGLVKNNGRFYLIISHEISEEDFLLIKEGYEGKKSTQENLLSRMDEELSASEQTSLFNLAYLIANGYVDIKIAFKKSGLFHAKYGLCYDAYGNIIYFTGSNNETKSAITSNYESFDVSANWLASDFDKEKIINAQQGFQRLWDNKVVDIFVMEIDDVIKNKILSFNKGRLIVDMETIEKDALVLTIENGNLVLYNQLESFEIKLNHYVIAKKLKHYFDNQYPVFKRNLNYIDIKNIVKIFEKYSVDNNFRFVVTRKLQNYIQENDFMIEQRAKYGVMLKSKHLAVMSDFENFKIVVDKELHRPLRIQQLWSAFYMAQMKKCANFSVPGSGKTSMVYGVYAFLSSPQINKVNKIVMIGPKNSFLSWKLEFQENFGGKRDLNVLDIHEEAYPEIQLKLNSTEKNLILINYESLAKYENTLLDIVDEKTILVFDEVHKIKGISSVRAEFAKRIATKTVYKYVLTGTPIPNSYQDIYNFLNVLYQDEYELFFNFNVVSLKDPTPTEINKINEKIFPFFWRTTKKQLLIPAADEDLRLYCPLKNIEQEIVDLLYRKYGNKIFLLYIRLLQAASNPELLLKSINIKELFTHSEENWDFFEDDVITFTEEEKRLIASITRSTKYQKAIELAEELYNENKQVIIWCMFIDTINKLKQNLENRGLKVNIIYGATPQLERERIIQNFKDKKIDVLITNPHTLAESVSLHKNCHDAIYLEYSFNLTHMLQSRDRIHRLGLPENQYTRYYYLISQGTLDKRSPIDEKIYWRLKEKQRIMEEAIDRNVLTPISFSDAEDVNSLFGI